MNGKGLRISNFSLEYKTKIDFVFFDYLSTILPIIVKLYKSMITNWGISLHVEII